MKTILKVGLAALCFAASVAQAAAPGPYLGAGVGTVGAGFNQHEKITGTVSGRVFAGYNINKYFGIEAGLARYGRSKSNFSFAHLSSSINHNINAIDLVGKVYLPVYEGFDLYGLGGVARVNSHNTVKNVNVNVRPFVTSGSTSSNAYRPIYGLGASYAIPNTKLTTNLEFTRIQGKGSSSSVTGMPSTNMVTLNLAYNFG